MTLLSREELGRMLDARLREPSIVSTQDAELWRMCGADRAVFVMDLSGFTRLTRGRGILHFLTVFRRARQIAVPIIESGAGRIVKCEADNVIACFPQARDAVRAAVAISQAALAENSKLTQDERVLPCIGIGFGRILELSDDFFGDEVNVAFKLGEDIARAHEVLLTQGAADRLGHEEFHFEADRLHGQLGGVQVDYYRLRTPPTQLP
jgi:adenylate cyclase